MVIVSSLLDFGLFRFTVRQVLLMGLKVYLHIFFGHFENFRGFSVFSVRSSSKYCRCARFPSAANVCRNVNVFGNKPAPLNYVYNAAS
jgi:hypothetical protein